MGKAEYKVKGGKLIKVQLSRKGNEIIKIKITGDFFMHPEERIEELEKALPGSSLNEETLTKLIRNVFGQRETYMLGVSPIDFAKCIMMAGENDG